MTIPWKLLNGYSDVKDRAYLTSGEYMLDVLKDDPDDNMILACAIEGQATHLITGNKKHFPFEKYKDIKILTPRQFIDDLQKE